jgi:hypothetical protein
MLVNRMIRAAMLDPRLYEEVEHDRRATGQAMQVVIIVALASGIGAALWKLITLNPIDAVTGLIGGIVAAVVGWLIWAFVTYIIGTGLFGGTASYGEMLRTLGFAQSPNVLLIFAAVPFFGGLLRLILLFWVLLAGLIAIRQALDVSTGKAIFTALIGWIVMAIAVFIIAAITGIGV